MARTNEAELAQGYANNLDFFRFCTRAGAGLDSSLARPDLVKNMAYRLPLSIS